MRQTGPYCPQRGTNRSDEVVISEQSSPEKDDPKEERDWGKRIIRGFSTSGLVTQRK
jgi:hypothetical protein